MKDPKNLTVKKVNKLPIKKKKIKVNKLLFRKEYKLTSTCSSVFLFWHRLNIIKEALRRRRSKRAIHERTAKNTRIESEKTLGNIIRQLPYLPPHVSVTQCSHGSSRHYKRCYVTWRETTRGDVKSTRQELHLKCTCLGYEKKEMMIILAIPPEFPLRTVICLAEASCRTSAANRRTFKIINQRSRIKYLK